VNGSVDAQEDREVQLYSSSQVPRPEGLATQAGATSVCKAVRFWIGTANAKSDRRRYSKENRNSIAIAPCNYIVALISEVIPKA
jgi:hypothetical protein